MAVMPRLNSAASGSRPSRSAMAWSFSAEMGRRLAFPRESPGFLRRGEGRPRDWAKGAAAPDAKSLHELLPTGDEIGVALMGGAEQVVAQGFLVRCGALPPRRRRADFSEATPIVHWFLGVVFYLLLHTLELQEEPTAAGGGFELRGAAFGFLREADLAGVFAQFVDAQVLVAAEDA
jgi:hypothetical protein